MLTETKKRVLRAMAMLDSGMDAKEVARECGYKNVNGMMGAIALHGRKDAEAQQEDESKSVCVQTSETPAAPLTTFGADKSTQENTVHKAPLSAMVETGGVRLQYNAVTDSVMISIPGNPRFLWIGRRDVPAERLMRGLRDAAGAMAILIEEQKRG